MNQPIGAFQIPMIKLSMGIWWRIPALGSIWTPCKLFHRTRKVFRDLLCSSLRNVDATTFSRDFGRTASLRRVVARSQSRPLARCTDRTGHFWNIRSRVSLSLSTAKAHLHIWRRCRSFDGTHPGLPRDHFTKSESNALSFYRSQNVLSWSKFFVPDQKFIYILWQSQTFCARFEVPSLLLLLHHRYLLQTPFSLFLWMVLW